MRRFPFNPFREPEVNAPMALEITEMVEMQSYVWCDMHGCVHESNDGYYDAGEAGCNCDNWRPIFIDGERGEVF